MVGHSAPVEELDDFPILGEPFAVEFANTDYDAPGGALDYLADARSASRWLAHVAPAIGGRSAAHLAGEQVRGITLVRDATKRLLMDLTGGAEPSESARRTLQRTASRVDLRLSLSSDDGTLAWVLHPRRVSGEGLVVAVSIRCILFLGSDDAARVRRCATPECPMLFVQRHRSRRFCGPWCAHSTRQARYYRSLKESRYGH